MSQKDVRLDLMRVNWWKFLVPNCNWKVAQEAFMEGYHVMQAHPNLSKRLRLLKHYRPGAH